ncbi:DLW-39 family protein [Marmoricola endophyticus]|uniref:DLW-39 family protein n=1 Tax=Marmoricola endophyticus TaxID=2040280 RepID=UPI00166E763A|nr:DLW-39 family protein [Marmoricola endophyticus]
MPTSGGLVKKILLVALAVAAGVVAKRRVDAANEEQSLWREATDAVTGPAADLSRDSGPRG